MAAARRIIFHRTISAGKLIIHEEITIEGDYNLCILQNEELLAPLSSLATLSIAEMRLTTDFPNGDRTLCSLANESLITSPTSVYDLSQVAP